MSTGHINTRDLGLDVDNLEFAVTGFNIGDADTTITTHNDMDAMRYLNHSLLRALDRGASDIHLEPYSDKFRVRYRVDGIMQDIDAMPKGFGHLLTARLKVIAGLDISEQRTTQSGRFKMMLPDNGALDFRCSITPTMHGETCVLRILYMPEDLLALDQLGLTDEQKVPVLAAVNRQQGMILVTGPTGSGKTVTLYTLIKLLNKQPRSIYTVEDPIEIEMSGVNQVSVAERINFADAARSLLRQDPDVIMLGEMRDAETIDTAIKAAHTGHLVLSTLHANSAPKAVPRLRNLGVPPYDIASTVSLVISQRLLRKLDMNHREPVSIPKQRLLGIGLQEDEIEDLKLYRATPNSDNNGYQGRVGVFQVMRVTEELAQMIADGATDADLERAITAYGVADLRCSALQKLREGLTDVDEIERVFGLIESAENRHHGGIHYA